MSIWRVRLARSAERDLAGIVRWTAANFGGQQASAYVETIQQALVALHDGPDVMGARMRDDIDLGIKTLHVARMGRKGRHFVVFRVVEEQTIDVLRVLHDSMDLPAHLSSDNFQN